MAVTTTRTSPTPGPVAVARPRGFRPDIEGLRALAIIPVLVFHAHEFLSPTAVTGPLGLVATVLGWVPGGYLGVDVFFVISGFLITGLLVREAETTDGVHFGRFYARRARRILPAATVTLLVTLVASLLILPAVRAGDTAVDVLWAALFNSDVHFANSGVDYMGVATAPSPVLHFWSLNDEEKFYVVWPVVLLVATLLARRVLHRRLRPTLFAALVLLAVPSLVWSQHLVSSGDTSAYFSAFSRAFELAAGGLLAIAMPLVTRAPRAARVIAPILGFGIVVWCMATFTTLTPFPGVNVLPVVVGTLLVIAGHEAGVVSRGLSTPVPRWFGRVSYSLYLWHWPVFVLAAALTASGQLGIKQVLLCMVVAVLLSWASYAVVEQPPQRLRAASADAAGAAVRARPHRHHGALVRRGRSRRRGPRDHSARRGHRRHRPRGEGRQEPALHRRLDHHARQAGARRGARRGRLGLHGRRARWPAHRRRPAAGLEAAVHHPAGVRRRPRAERGTRFPARWWSRSGPTRSTWRPRRSRLPRRPTPASATGRTPPATG